MSEPAWVDAMRKTVGPSQRLLALTVALAEALQAKIDDGIKDSPSVWARMDDALAAYQRGPIP